MRASSWSDWPLRVVPPRARGLVAIREGAQALALTYSPEAFEEERAGLDALGEHPCRPTVLASTEDTLVLAARSPRASDVGVELGTSERFRRERFAGPRRALLAEWTGLRAGRALRGGALSASKVDRFLDASIEVEIERGPSLGAPLAPFWSIATDMDDGIARWVALRFRAVETDGSVTLDRAALTYPGLAPIDDEVARLAAMAIDLRQGENERAIERVRSTLVGESANERVRVTVEGPAFLPSDLWEAPGALVSPTRARWLLANVDGMAVGGGAMRVRTEPAIRRGRRPPRREDPRERRARLFTRWNEGVRVDDEGLVGLTPEAIAMRLAEGARGTVLDLTCGVGGLAIAFARQPGVRRVIAVDRSAERLAMAEHNARIYGVSDRIELVHDDATRVAERMRAELTVIDPPWGGRGYDRERMSMADLAMPVPELLAAIEGPVLLKLPRSFDVAELPSGARVEGMVDERGILKMLAVWIEGGAL
ncbi:MAG: methyltransferase [Sandaracinaceae bacterium]